MALAASMSTVGAMVPVRWAWAKTERICLRASFSKSPHCMEMSGLRVASAQISMIRTAFSRGSSMRCLRPIASKATRKSCAEVMRAKSAAISSRSRSERPETIASFEGK